MSANQVKRWKLILNGLATKLEGTEWVIDADKGIKPRCVLACGGLEQDVVNTAVTYRERLDTNAGNSPGASHSAPRMWAIFRKRLTMIWNNATIHYLVILDGIAVTVTSILLHKDWKDFG